MGQEQKLGYLPIDVEQFKKVVPVTLHPFFKWDNVILTLQNREYYYRAKALSRRPLFEHEWEETAYIKPYYCQESEIRKTSHNIAGYQKLKLKAEFDDWEANKVAVPDPLTEFENQWQKNDETNLVEVKNDRQIENMRRRSLEFPLVSPATFQGKYYRIYCCRHRHKIPPGWLLTLEDQYVRVELAKTDQQEKIRLIIKKSFPLTTEYFTNLRLSFYQIRAILIEPINQYQDC